MQTAANPDPRAAVEYRVPAMELRAGDLVNTSPGEDDWQQIVRVCKSAADAADDEPEVRELLEQVDGRYVLVQMTDLAPVDSNVHFEDGRAVVAGDEDSADEAVTDLISHEDGLRSYLYTRYELVSVRASGSN
jgi:hypothetical protein